MSDFPHANQRLGDRCTAVGMGADNHWPLDVHDNRSNDLCIVIQIPQLGGLMAPARQSDRADVDAAEPLDRGPNTRDRAKPRARVQGLELKPRSPPAARRHRRLVILPHQHVSRRVPVPGRDGPGWQTSSRATSVSVAVTGHRDRLFDEVRFGLSALCGEPGSMCWRVRAQCPLPADPVNAYRVHGQGAVGLDV